MNVQHKTKSVLNNKKTFLMEYLRIICQKTEKLLERSKLRSEISALSRKTLAVDLRQCIYTSPCLLCHSSQPRNMYEKTLCSTNKNKQTKKPSSSSPPASGRPVSHWSSAGFISQQLKHTKQDRQSHPIGNWIIVGGGEFKSVVNYSCFHSDWMK